MRLWVGTSGFSYKQWKGTFYPGGLADRDMLTFYAGRFPSVELNNTFYRIPRRETLEKWAGEVGDEFVFAVKASRRITHVARLKDTQDSVDYLFGKLECLGSKLGPVLVQLPPNLKKDTARLGRFLDGLPEGRRVAFEFRSATWKNDEVWGLLSGFDQAWCVSDEEPKVLEGWTAPREMAPVHRTATWGYLRLRRCDYTEEELRDWATQIRRQRWTDAYVYFKHEEDGRGPEIAERFCAVFETTGEATTGEALPSGERLV